MARNDLLDALRGLAVIAMLIFHLAVDLEDFFGYAVGYRQGGWQALRYYIVLSFVGISGYTAGSGLNRHIMRNACKTMAGALLVTLFTYWFLGDSYVRFGILHFLACALFLAPVLLRRGDAFLLLLAAASLLTGRLAASYVTASPFLIPLGIVPAGFVSVDYYPLFPWLTVFIAGLWAGRRWGGLPGGAGILKPAAFLGRRALLIYLLHQPVFLLFLYAFIG